VIQNMLLVECSVTFQHILAKKGMKLVVLFNPAALSCEVHGERHWNPGNEKSAEFLFYQATDQIRLSEWLRRSGDYQGDFLIPEGWRRIIFKKPVVSGLGHWENVHAGYHDSALKIYDADTFVAIGGKDFAIQPHVDGWHCFSADLIRGTSTTWKSPLFITSFSVSAPLISAFYEKIAGISRRNQAQNERYRMLQSRTPRLLCPQHPALSRFFEIAPQIIESAKVHSVGMTRACPGTYYWIWAWDNLVTASALARWGDTAGMRRIVDFIRTHRDIDGAIPCRWTRDLQPMDSRGIGAMDFLFSQLVLTLYSETGDRQVIRANYPVLVDSFRILADRIDLNGFYQTIGMYPDLPGKMGRTETSYVAIDAGAWYCFLRNIEKMARLLDDDRTASLAVDVSRRVADGFQKLFWDDKKGFIADSVDSATGIPVKSFPL
ncbi:hypothetical protein KAH55_14655, partial [bacterium]|nr:hypothetical protein [bacterium]